MASPGYRPSPELTSANTPAGANELINSLNKLSISTSGAAANSKPSKPFISKTSPDYLQTKFPRSPLIRTNSIENGSRSRSATPTLLRKSSTTSLRSTAGGAPLRAPSRKTSATNLRSPNTSRPSSNRNSFNMSVEKPAPTEASIAKDYFKKELEMLHSGPSPRPTDTIIILHDACYGHRFSRPRATKGVLNTIVERPERIQASVLGVSAAYVRLGERHCEGKVPLHPQLDPASVPSIPFRILKTDRRLPLDAPAVTNVHGTKWMEELKIMCESAETKLALNGNELRRPEMNRGADSEPPQKFHEGDLYLCSESQSAFEGALGAVCEAVDTVFSDAPQKRAFVAVRPPGHHCSATFPSGFCWVNNVQVGIMHAVLNHGLTHAAIIDFDLHHGDGSQAITWAHNKRGLPKNSAAWKKTSIGYFSLHDINSYPCEYGDEEKVKNASLCIDNAHGQNIWNVHLQEWKTEIEFWKLYQSKYLVLLEKARNFLRLQTERIRAAGQKPKAAIFLSAGFDASEWEGAGMQRHKVNVPTEFYARITRDVVKIAGEEDLGVDGRIISVLEGGYSDRALYSGVLSHLGGLAGNEPIYGHGREDSNGGLAHEIGSRTGSTSRRNTLSEMDSLLRPPRFPYDPSWWSVAELDRLDSYTVPAAAKVPRFRDAPLPTYSSPTQASEAKLTEIAKLRRSLSGAHSSSVSQTYIPRPPTPPPPEVPWTAATHELCKLLVPNNRQIDSCKHEELNPEGTKTKRDRRQSLNVTANNSVAATLPTRPSTRMSLRERKPTRYTDPDSDSEKGRRRTVGGALALEKANARGKPTSHPEARNFRQHDRRLSSASTMSTATQGPESTGTELRPSTSHMVRPVSSASVHISIANSQNTRKTRPTAPPKKDNMRAPRTTKSSESTPTETDAAASQTDAFPDTMQNTAAAPRQASVDATSGTGDLDKLTNGMKRIKINVLTKEKKEARQREAAEKAAAAERAALDPKPNGINTNTNRAEEKTRRPVTSSGTVQFSLPSSTPQYPPRPKSSGTGASSSSSSRSPPGAISSSRRAPPPIPPPMRTKTEPLPPTTTTNGNGNGTTTIPTILTPTTAENGHLRPSFSPPQTPDIFVPYRPDGPPAAAVPLSGPVRILDPNTGTPRPRSPGKRSSSSSLSPSKKAAPGRGHARTASFEDPPRTSFAPSPDRYGHHGFTATSAIPFARQPVGGAEARGEEEEEEEEEDDDDDDEEEGAVMRTGLAAGDTTIWEVPESPDNRRKV